MGKILRVTVRVEEYILNDDDSAFEKTDEVYEFITESSGSSVYEALIRGTDAALLDYRFKQMNKSVSK